MLGTGGEGADTGVGVGQWGGGRGGGNKRTLAAPPSL